MLDLKKSDEQQDSLVSLQSLAELTGFPVEMIKKELFTSHEASDQVSLDQLRTAMAAFIDATMLEE